MIQSDFHLHSHFSGDCDAPMEEVILYAISQGMASLCFTDHHDLDFPHPTINFVLDIEPYFEALQNFRSQYQDKIDILFGIELGMQKHLHTTLSNIVRTHPFDYVIASNHLANGIDPYDRAYFEGRSRSAGYLSYFEDMLLHAKTFTDYDCYGHLDYVIRYGDFTDKNLIYNDFKEVLDEILRNIIQNGKGIEVNTSGYRYKLGNPHPNKDILAHYKALGGEIITFGSDAHSPKFLMSRFDEASALLKSIGYTHYTTFKNRKPTFMTL